MNTVIINSIGTAKPSVTKILAESFKLPQEYFLKQIYNAPSLLFTQVSDDLAQKAKETLQNLGLEISLNSEVSAQELNTPSGDISIYLEDLEYLPQTINDVSEFLGCSNTEALNIICKEPVMIIGGVSEATAKSLQKRTNAKVCFSIPKEDLYTITIPGTIQSKQKNEIEKFTNKSFSEIDNDLFGIADLDYKTSMSIWRKFEKSLDMGIINQSHQLSTVVLEEFDENNETQKKVLADTVGIPINILPKLKNDLPILLFENIAVKHATCLLQELEKVGITVSTEKKFSEKLKIKITDIKDIDAVKSVLQSFFEKDDLPTNTNWESKKILPKILTNFILHQLHKLDCKAQLIKE